MSLSPCWLSSRGQPTSRATLRSSHMASSLSAVENLIHVESLAHLASLQLTPAASPKNISTFEELVRLG